MAKVKRFTSCVALLADQVQSRHTDRATTHSATLDAIDSTNARVPSLDALRVTVGDELQGLYATMGDVLTASHVLRGTLLGTTELRFGLGGGDVRVIDLERGIQDGSAWWNARDAIDEVEALAGEPGYSGLRTGIRDERDVANPLTVATVRIVDAQLARLRVGAREALRSLLDGLDNRTAAKLAGISPSANSQRVNNNDLRVVAGTIQALGQLQ